MRLKMGVRRTIIIRHCAAGQAGVPSSTLYRRIREINVVLSSLGPLEGNARMLLERVCPSPDLDSTAVAPAKIAAFPTGERVVADR
jgi:hypothetical protein